MDDSLLLRRYVEDHSQAAFAALVDRHVNLVYFAALRRANGDPHQAEDIAQGVFTTLSRKAAALTTHTTLAGWLYTTTQFTAREAARREQRRRHREQKAHAMNEALDQPARDPDWEQVRPVIDDALHDLAPADREAVLLRFFQNRPYAEIGDALRLTENAARMRVERALDKLHQALARRGVTSTATALTTALAVPAASATPAGLAQQFATAALAAGSAAGGTAALATFFSAMTSTKIAVVATGAAALVAVGVALHQHHELVATRSALDASLATETQLRSLVDNLEWRIAAAHERAAQPGARAGAAGVGATASAPSGVAAAPAVVTRDMVEARLKQAKEFAASGRPAEALGEYLWCYDTGMRQVDGYFLVRYSSLLQSIADLGETYPPALDALRVRRDAAKDRLLASANDMAAGKDFGSINRVLGENAQTYALFDSLSEDDPRRQHLIDTSIDRLIDAQRYRELSRAMPYSGMPQVWEEMTQVARSPAVPAAARPQVVRRAVDWAAAQIEARAGAGDLLDASDFIERVLIFDNSPETVASIQRHLERAGHPELFKGP